MKVCTQVLFASLALSATGVWADDNYLGTKATPVTAQDQSVKPADAELTRKIRAELMDRDLSTQAKNVTVVTIDGVVTLKGTVPNANEKNVIGEVAKGVATNVQNQIVVKQQ